jgi:murein tripeptide amidase MpaA
MSGNHRRTVQGISRRRLLAAGGLAFSALAVGANLARAQGRAATLKRTVIGKSQGGQPITLVHLGGDRRRVLVLGGQHGSPEGNTVTLADAILDYFAERERDIPKGIGLDIIPVANPDGFIDGSRQYRSGVDPNRNWASGDWEPDAYDSW